MTNFCAKFHAFNPKGNKVRLSCWTSVLTEVRVTRCVDLSDFRQRAQRDTAGDGRRSWHQKF